MQKIPSLYQRNYDTDRLVRDEHVPGTEWVAQGEGVATRKVDGTSVRVSGGQLYKRYDAKGGKTPPVNFEPAQPAPDPTTGHWPGWVPADVQGADPGDQYHREAWHRWVAEHHAPPPDGTYELIGPKVQGNAEQRDAHELVRHGEDLLPDAPRDFAGLRAYLDVRPAMEGIVWHHPDGRMVKIKRKDFFRAPRRR